MYEEPELVMELYEYLSDFYCTVYENQLKYWGDLIDVFNITDDTATATNPFISPERYQRMVKPYHARLGKFAQDRGIHAQMHNCGRCEDFIDDWIDFGIDSWNPAQIVNDLDGIKLKYGNKMVLIGCWDSQGPVGWPYSGEEVVKKAVHKGGGFMFYGSSYGLDDEPTENKKKWITEAYEDYRADPYK
jgi:uroporphyrinogen-III decarboxylase